MTKHDALPAVYATSWSICRFLSLANNTVSGDKTSGVVYKLGPENCRSGSLWWKFQLTIQRPTTMTFPRKTLTECYFPCFTFPCTNKSHNIVRKGISASCLMEWMSGLLQLTFLYRCRGGSTLSNFGLISTVCRLILVGSIGRRHIKPFIPKILPNSVSGTTCLLCLMCIKPLITFDFSSNIALLISPIISKWFTVWYDMQFIWLIWKVKRMTH